MVTTNGWRSPTRGGQGRAAQGHRHGRVAGLGRNLVTGALEAGDGAADAVVVGGSHGRPGAWSAPAELQWVAAVLRSPVWTAQSCE